MKQLFSLLLLTVILFAGCSEYNSNTPTTKQQQSVKKIEMPDKAHFSIENVFSATELIIGQHGGDLELIGSYESDNGTVEVYASIVFQSGSFNGARYISVVNDGAYVEVDLSPSMDFSREVFLNLRMTGLNLTGIDPSQVGFYYFGDQGEIEAVPYDQLIVDVENGTLEVVNARLTHFSRYGFAT